jgi:hypothetical protein
MVEEEPTAIRPGWPVELRLALLPNLEAAVMESDEAGFRV